MLIPQRYFYSILLMLYSKFVYSSPIVVLITKITYDIIYYGNLKESNIIASIICFLGSVKLYEIADNIIDNIQIPTLSYPENKNYLQIEDKTLCEENEDEPFIDDPIDFDDLMNDVTNILSKAKNINQ